MKPLLEMEMGPMCQEHTRRITRQDFLKLSGVVLGGASLACGGGAKLLELTAVPTPVATSLPGPVSTAAQSAPGADRG